MIMHYKDFENLLELDRLQKELEKSLKEPTKNELALNVAVSSIYFNSNSEEALWKIIRILGGQEAEDLLKGGNESVAFDIYCRPYLDAIYSGSDATDHEEI